MFRRVCFLVSPIMRSTVALPIELGGLIAPDAELVSGEPVEEFSRVPLA